MSDVDAIIAKWRRSGQDVRIGDVEKVIKAKIAPRAHVQWDKKSTSHVINMSHPCFREVSAFKGRDNFNVVLKEGRRVTRFYFGDLLDAIDALDDYERKQEAKERNRKEGR